MPSYWSRISNETVLGKLNAPKLSSLLLEQQLGFFGVLARRPVLCPVRQFVFEHDLSMARPGLKRRPGRPRAEWTNEMFKVVHHLFASEAAFRACVMNPPEWRERVRLYCRAQSQS